jgi:hypothetical protein
MPHHLRDGLSWCLCDQQAVFLDLPRDRYFRLGQDDDQHFQRWARSGAVTDTVAARLIGAGVLVASANQQPPQSALQVTAPFADLGEEACAEARLIDIGRSLIAQRWATAVIRRGKLPTVIAALAREHAPAPGPKVEAAVRRVAAAFASTPLAMRKARQCLPRALAANALCRAAGALPTLVFGVRVEPFAAHCWLQWNATVIVGDLEQTRMFTPILAVS